MSDPVTFYPGKGADELIAELQRTVGEITAFWAGVEDQLFGLFVVALTGSWEAAVALGPYRAVFFTFSAYEGKMRMVNNAMKSRYADQAEVLSEWRNLKQDIDSAAALRNEVAHLIPMAKSSQDPNADANVRLVPAFWKNSLPRKDFDLCGYSLSELYLAFAPYCGFHPRVLRVDVVRPTLGWRLQEFIAKLSPPQSYPQTLSPDQ